MRCTRKGHYPFTNRGVVVLLVLLLGSVQSGSAVDETDWIRIVSTNDLHTYLRPVYYRFLDQLKPWGAQSTEGDYVAKARLEGKVGGMAHVATVIKELRSQRPGKTLVVDAGDTWHGAGLSLVDRGRSMVKIMNAIGYDAMTPGNWEFFYPRDHLLDLIDQATFPVIAHNVTDKEWDEPVFTEYVIKELGKLKVAIIGLTYPWTALTSAVTGSAQWWQFGIREQETRDLMDEIRTSEDPDLMLIVSHGGYGMDQKFARRVDGIDVLVSGHTHDQVFDPVVWNGAIIYQGGAHGEYVASLDVKIEDKRIIDYSYRLVKVKQSETAADPEIQALVDDAYRPHEKRLGEVIGHAAAMIYRRDYLQSPMGNLLTDALRSITGADLSFFPAWRYGATLMPGKITVEDVYNIVPTDGRIITYSMPGKAVKQLLDNILNGVVDRDPYSRVGGDMIRFSGAQMVYELDNRAGEKIVSLSVGGKPFSEEQIYTVASVHTRFQDNPLFGATSVEDTGKVFVEALIEYIRARSPITASVDNRMRSKGSLSAGP